MQQNIQMKTNEIQREGRKKDRLERELRQAKTDVDTKTAEIKTLQLNLDQSTANIAKLNGDIKDQKVSRSYLWTFCCIRRLFTDLCSNGWFPLFT